MMPGLYPEQRVIPELLNLIMYLNSRLDHFSVEKTARDGNGRSLIRNNGTPYTDLCNNRTIHYNALLLVRQNEVVVMKVILGYQ